VQLAVQIPVGVVVYALALLLFARPDAMAVLEGTG
jgi:hypothetical protein